MRSQATSNNMPAYNNYFSQHLAPAVLHRSRVWGQEASKWIVLDYHLGWLWQQLRDTEEIPFQFQHETGTAIICFPESIFIMLTVHDTDFHSTHLQFPPLANIEKSFILNACFAVSHIVYHLNPVLLRLVRKSSPCSLSFPIWVTGCVLTHFTKTHTRESWQEV